MQYIENNNTIERGKHRISVREYHGKRYLLTRYLATANGSCVPADCKTESYGQKRVIITDGILGNQNRPVEKQKHEVFEPTFDRKECYSIPFMKQKTDYIHQNPCKAGMVQLPQHYLHSSAKYYYTGGHGRYPVMTYMELQDVDLNLPLL